MKELKIQNSIFTILVDDEDYERLSKFKWFNSSGRIFRNTSKEIKTEFGYIINKPFSKSISNEILGTINTMYDHKDRNPLNNSKENLRKSMYSNNNANSIKSHLSKNKFRGVSWHKRNRLWIASISVNCKRLFLGYFKKEIDAALAYNDSAKKYHGEFAVLNEV